MNRNNNKIYAVISYGIIIAAMFLLLSCSDTSIVTPTPEKKNYFPLDIGNYWLFDSYDLDFQNARIPDTDTRDSLVVVAKEMVRSHDSYVLHWFTDGVPTDTLYITKIGEAVYRLFDTTVLNVPDLNSQWIKIFDPKLEDWHDFDTLFYGYPYSFLDETIDSSETQYTMNTTLLSRDSINLGVIKIPSSLFRSKLDSRALWSYYFPDDELPQIVQRLYQQIFLNRFGENVGPVAIEKSSSSIKTTSTSDKYSGEVLQFRGKRSLLTGFHISESSLY